MTTYKGIKLSDNQKISEYISLYSSITDDFDNDKPLQDLVHRHYRKNRLLVTAFNLSVYVLLYSLVWLIK